MKHLAQTLKALKRSCWVDTRREGVWMHYSLARESCAICKELLQSLKKHAATLPEAASDRDALLAFRKATTGPTCP